MWLVLLVLKWKLTHYVGDSDEWRQAGPGIVDDVNRLFIDGMLTILMIGIDIIGASNVDSNQRDIDGSSILI